LPTSESFFKEVGVTVMIWQPTWSAWKMLSSSRGLAQMSSIWGYIARICTAAAMKRHGVRGRCPRDGGREHGDARRRPGRQRRRDVADLGQGHERRHVELDARLRQGTDQWERDSPSVLVTGILT